MKNILLLALTGLITSPLLGQAPPSVAGSSKSTTVVPVVMTDAPKGNGKITGYVLDELTKKPIEFATVALLQKENGKPIDGTITDEKGRFALTKLATGQYTLSISFLGFETKTLDNLTIGKDEVQVGSISLKSSSKTLNEVAVTGEKALVEDKVDRMVYNAEKDITNIGGTASDVLKKVPGLTVDLDGNVQLRGSSNIRVLINNKPSTVMATSIADAMRQIPSDQIKTVEVITSPSAKYDAEGTAGIINIVLKKNNLQGINGNANASYGTRNSNVGGNVNFRKGKFGLNTALGHNWNNNPGKNTIETDYFGNTNIDRLSQKMTGRRVGTFDFVQIGTDYDLNKKNNIAAGIRLQTGDFAFKTTQLSRQYLNNEVTGQNTRNSVNAFDVSNYDINLDYQKTFTKPGQELTFLGLLSRSNRNTDNQADIYDAQDQLALKEKNINEAFNEEITLQTDYVHPLKNSQVVEVGAKAILRYAESDYNFSVARPAYAPYIIQPSRSDVFSYNQDVVATYLSYGFSLQKKYNFKLGTRYEYTNIKAEFLKGSLTLPDYDNFIPSIAVSRTLKNNQTVKFNYSKRIQRPQLFFLNPFENRMDTFNIQVGNPNLDAELTNAYELSYSTFFKSGTSINTSVYWRQTNNSIQSYILPSDGVVNTTTFGNIGRNASYGMSVFGNTKFLKKGNISGNVNVFYTDLESASEDLKAANASLMYNTNLNLSYAFDKGFSAQMFGMFNSPRVTLQGKSSSWSYYNVAVKKEILKKKGSISVGIDNPFSKTLKQVNTFKNYNTDNELLTDQNSTLFVYTRQFRASLNYQFGKMDNKNQPRRKKKISNDDAKSGGDGNSGQ